MPRPALPLRLQPAVAALLLALSTASPPAAAQAAPPAAMQRDYDLPAGPLAATLNRIAREAGLALTVDAQLVAGRQAAAVRGRHDAPSALRQALQGTGLELLATTGGGYTLRAAPAAAAPAAAVPAAAGARLAEVRVVGSAPAASEGTRSYAARGTTLGRTEQALKDIPQSVTVLTRQLIDDQQLGSLNELMEQAPGIVVVKDSNAYQAFYARGFRIDNYQVDGAGVSYGAVFRPDFDLAIYDRVEVLRGAEGLFSAAGEPSGTVNLVRKRPTAAFQGRASVSTGSWSNHRAEIDLGGPLAWDGRLRGRLVAAHQDRDFFYKPSDQKKSVLYGVLETDLGPATLLTAGLGYQRQQGVHWTYGLPTYTDGGDIGLPRSRALTTDWARKEQTNKELFVTLEHAVNADWTAKLNLMRQEFDEESLGFTVAGGVNRSTRAFAFANGSYQTSGNHADTVDASMAGGFDLWGRRHQLVAGADWRRSEAIQLNRYTSISTYPGTTTLDTDFSGGAFARPDVLGLRGGWPHFGGTQKGVYAKLQLQASDALRVILGGRYGSYAHDEPSVSYDVDGVQTDASDYRYSDSGIFTPYAGLVYDLGSDWAAYASLTEIYKPQSNYRQGPPERSTPLDPVKGRNAELGVKGTLFGGALNASVALYRIERTGEAAEDLSYPYTPGDLGSACCYVAQGKIVSQGLDAEVSGQAARGWQVFAGYTYNQNRNKVTNEVFHAITPRHMVKLWTTYELPGELSAWKLGGGVNFQSRQANQGMDWVYDAATGWDQAAFAIRQGGYAVFNASVQYRIARDWTLALNARNLFDKHYYQTLGTPRGGNWYGEPRSVALTLRGSF
ncbi:MAG: TonB-dependent siderophore receptor [Pseudorhodoferax sp.]